jgi:hypothetical protein
MNEEELKTGALTPCGVGLIMEETFFGWA